MNARISQGRDRAGGSGSVEVLTQREGAGGLVRVGAVKETSDPRICASSAPAAEASRVERALQWARPWAIWVGVGTAQNPIVVIGTGKR